jgi:hypothetical protein
VAYSLLRDEAEGVESIDSKKEVKRKEIHQ